MLPMPKVPILKASRFMNKARELRKSKNIAIRDFAKQCNIKLVRYAELENGVAKLTQFERLSIETVIKKYEK